MLYNYQFLICTFNIIKHSDIFFYFFNIATNAHTIYTLKNAQIYIKTLKNLPLQNSDIDFVFKFFLEFTS